MEVDFCPALEQALITHLQKFLLELGRGFSFVARQKRITFDRRHFRGWFSVNLIIIFLLINIAIMVLKMWMKEKISGAEN